MKEQTIGDILRESRFAIDSTLPMTQMPKFPKPPKKGG